mmetsp:Transcript_37763/g.79929  ORF Transcript_37763/g.79929 Transcript_37763/m.79929 type:complete len:321 (+) Transcript_37763:752-1714(+)
MVRSSGSCISMARSKRVACSLRVTTAAAVISTKLRASIARTADRNKCKWLASFWLLLPLPLSPSFSPPLQLCSQADTTAAAGSSRCRRASCCKFSDSGNDQGRAARVRARSKQKRNAAQWAGLGRLSSNRSSAARSSAAWSPSVCPAVLVDPVASFFFFGSTWPSGSLDEPRLSRLCPLKGVKRPGRKAAPAIMEGVELTSLAVSTFSGVIEKTSLQSPWSHFMRLPLGPATKTLASSAAARCTAAWSLMSSIEGTCQATAAKVLRTATGTVFAMESATVELCLARLQSNVAADRRRMRSANRVGSTSGKMAFGDIRFID